MIEVILDLNFESQKLPPMMGLVIDMHSGTEHWDLPAIRKKVGNTFYTDS
jgi:ribosomal protein S19